MNAKLRSVLSEMEKTEQKIVQLQEKWNALNKKKTELENLEIIGLVRGANISTENLSEAVRAYSKNGSMPFKMQLKQEDKQDEKI